MTKKKDLEMDDGVFIECFFFNYLMVDLWANIKKEKV